MKRTHTVLTLIPLFLFTLSLNAQNPTFEWVQQMGGTGVETGNSNTVDANGNVYITGFFNSTVDFDPGAGVTNVTSNGGTDTYLQKLDGNGNLLWVEKIGGTGNDIGLEIKTDLTGNVYCVGHFEGSVDFDPGAGNTTLTSAGIRDIFILKLDGNGNFIWAKRMGGIAIDRGYTLTLDGNGNVITSGDFQGTVDFDPGTGNTTLTAVGNYDIFIQKLDGNGNFIWAKSMGGTGAERGYSLDTDANGNVYTLGYFEGTADFNPGTGTANLTSVGLKDIFIQKLDANGNFLWAIPMGGTANDNGNSLTVDANGNVYSTGHFQNTVDFDPGVGTTTLTAVGNVDIFIQKLDGNGNLVWVKQIGGTASEVGRSITTDAQGNVYTTGDFFDTVDFDPGTGTSNLTAIGSYDIFVQKLDGNGNLIWVKQMGGTLGEAGSSIAVEANGNVYTTGLFYGTVDFDPEVGTTNLTVVGTYDIFVHKFSQCTPTTGTEVVTACDSYTWMDGNTYTVSNSTAMDTLVNAEGCDSVVTLNLTLNYSTSGTAVITECDSFTWIDGNTYTASNNTATHTLQNATGCDSVVTLDLTINSVSDLTTTLNNATVMANNSNGSYQWLDCDDYGVIANATNQSFTATTNGSYAVEITENGCVDTSDCVLINIVGRTTEELGNRLIVYPNPTEGHFLVKLRKPVEQIEISIFDLSGRLMQTSTHHHTNSIPLTLTHPAGMYLLEIKTPISKQTLRLVKTAVTDSP